MLDRIILLVLDGVGIGEQHDAYRYSSQNANSFNHAASSVENFEVESLRMLGLGNIIGVDVVSALDNPLASYGRMMEISAGNDTFVGIWEIAGVIFNKRFSSFYPKMPSKLIASLQKHIGKGTLCNSHISGFDNLDVFADEHFLSAMPIILTCNDGVIIVSAHEEVIALKELFGITELMTEFFIGKGVSRIVVRPFIGDKGNFIRTANRRDFIVPFDKGNSNLYQRIMDASWGFTVTEHLATLIGKEYITNVMPGFKDCAGVIDSVCNFLRERRTGILMFVVPDFDLSGHRRNPQAYARDLMFFDQKIRQVLELIGPNDLLVITADHGCDPISQAARNHTREYVPLLVLDGGKKVGVNLGTRATFADLGQTICELIGTKPINFGKSFAKQIV